MLRLLEFWLFLELLQIRYRLKEQRFFIISCKSYGIDYKIESYMSPSLPAIEPVKFQRQRRVLENDQLLEGQGYPKLKHAGTSLIVSLLDLRFDKSTEI